MPCPCDGYIYKSYTVKNVALSEKTASFSDSSFEVENS
jgi:hypothetical protein